MLYKCLRTCLCQKHELDSLGRYVELVNLKAKEGEIYDEMYDLTKFNDNDDGIDFFEKVTNPSITGPTKRAISDIKPLERRMPPPKKVKVR